jgi:hypothetical protein
MDTHCQRCQHPWTSHGADGCTFHQGGAICHCMISNEAPSSRWIKCDPIVPKLLAEANARADRLDAENNERFSRETEYQNRIRELEARVRTLEQALDDVTYYLQRRR